MTISTIAEFNPRAEAFFGLGIAIFQLVEVIRVRDASVIRALAMRHVPVPMYRVLMGAAAVLLGTWSLGALFSMPSIELIGIIGTAGCIAVLLFAEAAFWVASQGTTDPDEE